MACSHCNRIVFKQLRDGSTQKHHQSLRDLQGCASKGSCKLCTIFWVSLKTSCASENLQTHVSGKVAGHEDITDTQIRLQGCFNENLPGFTFYPAGSHIRVISGPECDDKGNQISKLYSIANVYAEEGTPAAKHLKERYLTRQHLDVRLQLSLGWIRQCEAEHANCKIEEGVLMPTRLLSIGTLSHPTMRLCDTTGKSGRYAALSYSWGKDTEREITLYNKNKQSYYETIDELAMSQSHKDGIQIARELDFGYLWIDALCIIQDNFDDWAEQSANMARIYGNASITIVGGSAFDSREGFVDHALSRESESAPLPYSPPDKSAAGGKIYVTLSRSIEVGPVYERAWCFQESVLSRRMLVYGKDQLAYRCREGGRYENGAQTAYPWEEVGKYVLNPGSFISAPHMIELKALRCWYELVNQYTTKELWQPSDIIAALAGVAYLFEKTLKTRYLAGLWESDIRRGLLWKPNQLVLGPFANTPLTERRHIVKISGRTEEEKEDSRKSEEKLAAELRAPSWSWASVIGPVYQAKSSDVSRFSKSDNWRCFTRDGKKSWSVDKWTPNEVLMKPCRLSIKGTLLRVQCSQISVANSPIPVKWPVNPAKLKKHGVLLEMASSASPRGVGGVANTNSVVAAGIFDTATRHTLDPCFCMLVLHNEGLILQRDPSAVENTFRRLGVFFVLHGPPFASLRANEITLA